MGQYRVTFDGERVGRSHGIQPQTFTAEDADGLALAVYRFAKSKLGSRFPDVDVDLESMRGSIMWGRAGSFSIEAL